jgi:hypothetical protein
MSDQTEGALKVVGLGFSSVKSVSICVHLWFDLLRSGLEMVLRVGLPQATCNL